MKEERIAEGSSWLPRGQVMKTPDDVAEMLRLRACGCAPYRARTKGKTENGVGYVKKNAIAGQLGGIRGASCRVGA